MAPPITSPRLKWPSCGARSNATSIWPAIWRPIELNPEFLSREGVLSLRRLGFNRVSFGIQDADPDVQAAVNRLVPAEQLRRVMDWLREADFASVNVDLICGLPRQTPERFAATLELVQQLVQVCLLLCQLIYEWLQNAHYL